MAEIPADPAAQKQAQKLLQRRSQQVKKRGPLEVLRKGIFRQGLHLRAIARVLPAVVALKQIRRDATPIWTAVGPN